jgi:hypothetical protein
VFMSEPTWRLVCVVFVLATAFFCVVLGEDLRRRAGKPVGKAEAALWAWVAVVVVVHGVWSVWFL